MKTTRILLIAAASLSSCKTTDSSRLADATDAAAAPPASNWCYPAAKFQDVPVGSPFIAVICEEARCGGPGTIVKLDASCNTQVKLGSDARPQLVPSGEEYVYETMGTIRSGYQDGKRTDCIQAIQHLDANYDLTGISGTCRILKNTRLEGQHSFTIIKEGATAPTTRPQLPTPVAGSKIGRDFRTFIVDGKNAADLLDDMADTMERYTENFRTRSSETSGCLLNSRIAGNTDIQAHIYCRLPHEGRRCFGGLINEYRMHCPRQKTASDPRPWVKTYAPDFKQAFEVCFKGTDANAFKNGRGDLFPYFREQGKEWRSELFLAAFDSLEGLRDWSVDSQIELINKSKTGLKHRRIVDSYPAWDEKQPRYANISNLQAANIATEAVLTQQMASAGVTDFTLDMVAPPCDGSLYVPMLGGQIASHNQQANMGHAIAHSGTSTPPAPIELGDRFSGSARIQKGERYKFYIRVRIMDASLTAEANAMSDDLRGAVQQVLRDASQLGGVHRSIYNATAQDEFIVSIHLRSDATADEVIRMSNNRLSIREIYAVKN